MARVVKTARTKPPAVLTLMLAQVQEVMRGSRRALQAARVLPPDRAGEPVPSTWPPGPAADATVDAMLHREHG